MVICWYIKSQLMLGGLRRRVVVIRWSVGWCVDPYPLHSASQSLRREQVPTFTQLLRQHTECNPNCARSHVDAHETLSEISSKSAVRQAGLTSFIAVLLSHHSCNHLPSLWTKRNNSGGRIPVLMEVMLWSSWDKPPIMGRQWTILLAALQNISQMKLCCRCIPLHCPPLCKPLF